MWASGLTATILGLCFIMGIQPVWRALISSCRAIGITVLSEVSLLITLAGVMY